jgi:hypothetical protein
MAFRRGSLTRRLLGLIFSLLEGTVPFALHGMAVMHFLSIIATGVTLMDESACPFLKLVTAKL